MNSQLYTWDRVSNYSTHNVWGIMRLPILVFILFVIVNFKSFGQKKEEEKGYQVYEGLQEVLNEPLSERSCDLIKEGYTKYKDDSFASFMKHDR